MGQRKHSLILALVLLITAISSVQGEGQDEVITQTEGLEPHDGMHFFSGTSSTFNVLIFNTGIGPESIEINPSCLATFQILNENYEIVYDLENHRLCPNQKRGETLDSGEFIEMGALTYDWKDENGNLPEGTYILRTTGGINSVAEETQIEVRHQISLPSNLHFEATYTPFPMHSESSSSSDTLLIGVKIYNSGLETVTITGMENCDVMWSVTGQSASLSDLGCGNGEAIESGESLHLGWISHPLNIAENGQLSSSVWLMGHEDESVSLDWNHILDEHEETDGLSLHISSIALQDQISPSGADMDYEIRLRNNGAAARTIVYDASCPISIHIVDENGRLVYDDRLTNSDCANQMETLKVQPTSSIILHEGIISAMDENGCGWQGNQMMAVVQISGQGLSTILPIEIQDSLVAQQCRTNLQSTDDINFIIDTLTETENGLLADLSVSNLGENDFTFMWEDDCVIRTNVMRTSGAGEYSSTSGCGTTESATILQTGDSISFENIPIELHSIDDSLIGSHLIQITLRSYPSMVMEITHTINSPEIDSTESQENDDEIIEEEMNSNNQEELLVVSLLEGTWNHVRTDEGGCWILTTPNGEEKVLVSSEDSSLKTVTGNQGAYRTTEATLSNSNHCSSWQSGFIVREVIDQWTPKNGASVATETDVSTPDNIVGIILPATTVVVTTSLLSFCIVFILNTEWIRISVLNGGLVLIGMVRRRDYDGDFQRGRVVGYLVANPGVHFRALLGALDMSNGQLAHHLKVLEDQDLLWKRRDGRMMRYYPSTVDQRLDGENLPVPLLTPDPNSLQGRILNLLDATGNEIVNLSQKELSDRLESSQQLISHHLKTLEGYGLIERDKVGLRYRYRLTREAIFLLESTDLPLER
ncbi:MAG TPA: hypothetical protein QF555_00400 [Candidatus Thalassarchaeaceae archaeon]|nr:hypothetical protein [Candidatus Thalassarchaeaceae archaeon]